MPEVHSLRRWRQSNGVTLAVLADRIGVTPSHLSMIETGNKVPSLDIADKLSRETVDENGIPAVPLTEFVPPKVGAE